MREYREFDPDADTDFPDSPANAPMRRRRRPAHEPAPARRGRLTEHERDRLAATRKQVTEQDLPTNGDRWSTWGAAERGPLPRPGWVITALTATDTELGVLKTGKEADVHLVRRAFGDSSCLLAAKRYRSDDHRLFHRDAQYLEGRRMRRSRETRAMANRTSFGRNLIAEQWAVAEFATLGRLWLAGLPVPYPVQREGTELLLEFVRDDDGEAAPRLAQLRPDPDQLHLLWREMLAVLAQLAALGITHGDLSAYNVLVAQGKPVLIDLPQAVDLAANPSGPEILARDVRNITGWFTARGLPPEETDSDSVIEMLMAEAGLR
jgi:RIO kinase 1